MDLENIIIRSITAELARPIRCVVLRPGQPAAASVYPGDDDPQSFHLGAFLEDRLVAAASFLPERSPLHARDHNWRLRGMATLEEVRSCGIGGMLLERGMREVRERGGSELWCYGVAKARGFYERHGMSAIGDMFELPNTGPLYLFTLHFAEYDADRNS